MMKIKNCKKWCLVSGKTLLLYIIFASVLISCSHKKNDDVFAEYKKQTVTVDVICTKELVEDLELILMQEVATRVVKQLSNDKADERIMYFAGIEIMTIRNIQKECKKKGIISAELTNEEPNNIHKTTQN